MKKLLKIFASLLFSCVGVWIALNHTQAGPLTLQLAAQKNDTMIAKTVLFVGADPSEEVQDGMTALHVAGFLGADKVIPLYIRNGAPINKQDKEGRTALHLAAYAGNTSSVAALMDGGADEKVRETTNGMTPLHLAAVQGHAEAVQMLLDKGAFPSPLSKTGLTPLFIARQENKTAVVDVLRQNGARK